MIPAPKANVLRQIGLALEAGCDEEQMAETWGQFVMDWLHEAEKSEEYQRLLRDIETAFPTPPFVNGRYDISEEQAAHNTTAFPKWLAEWK